MTAGALALQATLIAAGTAGRAAHRLRPTHPTPAEVAALFRDASPGEAAAMARAIGGARFQYRALVEVARRGGQRGIAELVDQPSRERLRALDGGPAILVGWHVGPPFVVLAALQAAGLPVLVVRRAFDSRQTPGLDSVIVDGARGSGAAAFRAGLTRLREGGVVLIAADAREGGATMAVPCFGRARPMSRGAFALARLTGAPLVPIAAQLDHDRVCGVAVGAPVSGAGEGDALEASLARAAAAWLEAFVRQSPPQLRRCVLDWLTEAPLLT